MKALEILAIMHASDNYVKFSDNRFQSGVFLMENDLSSFVELLKTNFVEIAGLDVYRLKGEEAFEIMSGRVMLDKQLRNSIEDYLITHGQRPQMMYASNKPISIHELYDKYPEKLRDHLNIAGKPFGVMKDNMLLIMQGNEIKMLAEQMNGSSFVLSTTPTEERVGLWYEKPLTMLKKLFRIDNKTDYARVYGVRVSQS